jgi:hypothetical protein
MAPFTSRRNRHACPAIVALEDRTLLDSGAGTFASFSGTLASRHARATIPITISPADFNLASGHVLLGLGMETADRLQIVPDGRASVRTLADRAGSRYRLVELSAGTYALEVTASGSGGKSYSIAVSLAGATSGFQVGPQDLATIHGLEGQRRGTPGYVEAADVNRDGAIDARDLRLARLNLGAATTIRPLAVTLGPGAAATNASGAVYQPSVIVAGQTEPGARVVLYGIGDGLPTTTLSNDPSLVTVPAPVLTTTADAAGHYQLTINLAVGANALRVVASDGFGQQASARLTVTRVVDTTPPTIAIQTPTAGLTTNANVLVSGMVTDDVSGVASLQEQVDSGPFQAVAIDAAGQFVLTTALPLNGSADGMHTVHLHAIDGARNASDAFAAFGLDTTGPSITVASPGPNAAVASSPVVTGHVFDNLAGVATLFAQVDSGAFAAVAVDSAGNFRFATDLSSDGSSDGTHTVHSHAVDRAGNVSDASATFILLTYGINRALTTNPSVQQMPSVATDPLDPNHLVLAYMDYSLVTTGYAGIGVAVSHDRGVTWQYTALTLPAGFDQGAANPDVRFDGQGHVFVEYEAATFLGTKPPLTNPNFSDRSPGGFESNNGIFITRSDDGGLSWSIPVAISSQLYTGTPVNFEVIPDLAIDTFKTLPDGSPNPRYGTMYATWTRCYPPGQFPGNPSSTGGTDTMIAVSHDGGASWQTQLQPQPGTGTAVSVIQDVLNAQFLANGSQPGLGLVDQSHLTIGPEGDVYVSDYGDSYFEIFHSSDGAASFVGPGGLAFQATQYIAIDPSFNAGEAGLPGDRFRTNAVRDIVADPTRTGTVYAVEAVAGALVNPSNPDPGDIIFGRSTDYGKTWTQTVMVGRDSSTGGILNDDNDGQASVAVGPDTVVSGQVMPHMAVDSQGNLAVIWYDNRSDPTNQRLDVFGTVSSDGGQTFSPNFRLSDQSFDPSAGKFTDAAGQDDYYIGDFLGLSVADGTAIAAWGDSRSGNQNIETAAFSVNPAPAAYDDRFEPNNAPATATDLGTVLQKHLPKLAASAGDDDWIRLQALATGDLTVTANLSQPGAGLELELWDAGATTPLAVGTGLIAGDGTVTGEQIDFPGQAGTTYLVHVSGAPAPAGSGTASTGRVDYSLDLQSLTANLGTVVSAGQDLTLTPGAQIYDLMSAAAAGSVQVQLAPGAGATGNVHLELLDPTSRAVLASGSAASGSTIQASLTVQQGQSVLVHVAADPAATGPLRLEIANADQFNSPVVTSTLVPDGSGASEVALGDLNGDGALDMVVSNTLTNTVSVFLGNGDGTFQSPRGFDVGAFSLPFNGPFFPELTSAFRGLVLADFNRDGLLDVAVTNFATGDVSVLLGRGDGTFEPQRRFDATTGPLPLGVGDLNGDKIPDLVALDSVFGNQFTLASLLGRGDGTFKPELTTPIVSANGGDFPADALQVADLNGDGHPDVVAGTFNGQDLHVLLGNGDGTLTAGPVLAPTDGATLSDVVGDVNGDGIPDILATTFQSGVVNVFLGNGDGTFQAVQSYFAGQVPAAMALVDLDSQVTLPGGTTMLGPPDGHPDVVVANSGVNPFTTASLGPPGVVILPSLWDAQGHFTGLGAPVPLLSADVPIGLAVGDVNRDGHPDLAVVDTPGVRIFFSQPPVIPSNDTPGTARNLGTVVHVVEPTLTIAPGHEDAYFTLTVPTEAAKGSGDEVIDFSGDFQATTGAGLMMEVRDAAGDLLGSGERFQITAPQQETLTLHFFGATASDGTRGAGAYTLDVDVLPQVVSVEAQTLLPGQGGLPGGATASLVVTFQGDRLDPATAEKPANYTVTWLGPDGKAGTADDQVIPLATGFQSVVYDPSANIDVASGTIHPTAVRQTVTLLFSQPLPAGSYQVSLAPAIQAAPFSADESGMLSGGTAFAGHPLVNVTGGSIGNGALVTATDLVLESGALGNLEMLKSGNAFLTQLHDDLSALVDAQKMQQGGQANITPALIDQVLNRLEQGLGAPGTRTTTAVALVFDPVSIGVDDPAGGAVNYDLGSDDLTDTTMDSFVDVDGNIEIVILLDPPATAGDISVTVGDVPPDASGAAVVLGTNDDTTMDLTDDLDAGMTQFDVPPD